jgi:hypothetical protein
MLLLSAVTFFLSMCSNDTLMQQLSHGNVCLVAHKSNFTLHLFISMKVNSIECHFYGSKRQLLNVRSGMGGLLCTVFYYNNCCLRGLQMCTIMLQADSLGQQPILFPPSGWFQIFYQKSAVRSAAYCSNFTIMKLY